MGYLEHADYVFTNSFHCCILSILFEKEFFVGKRNGDKVDFLLHTFGLTSRKVEPGIDVSTMDITPIDYAPIRKILEEKRESSVNFILNAIHSLEKEINSDVVSCNKYEATDKVVETSGNSCEHGDSALMGKKTLHQLKKKDKYSVFYHAGTFTPDITEKYFDLYGTVQKTPRGALEYRCNLQYEFGKPSHLERIGFYRPGFDFLGWNGRVKLKDETWWYCTDGAFHMSDEIENSSELNKYLFYDGEEIRFTSIPGQGTNALVFEAVWKKQSLLSRLSRK